MKTRNILLAAAMATAGLGAVGAAIAQNAAPGATPNGAPSASPGAAYDFSQLPAIQGKVAQYSLTPRGDVDGLILADGTEVRMPPHLGSQLVQAVKPGDAVTIRGLRARNLPLVQAMQVSNDVGGASVADTGPGGPRGPDGKRGPGGPDARGPGGPDQPTLTAQGRIKAALHGRQGEVNGALLEDGTIVRLPPPEAQRLAAQIAPGATVYVEGRGYAGPLGRVIAARAIGPAAGSTTPIAAPPLKHGPGHGPGRRGPGGGPRGAGPDAPPPAAPL